MNYRGRDLDLRTPDRSTAAGGAWPVEADGPVLVDEAVLACCNHGYDLALAHRAREVRVEHLLNAMTRTDAAAAVLSGFGVDVTGLRQDTAGLIAADDNIVPGTERMSPRRSQLLADILHHASERARRRGSTVMVADLLRSLFELNLEQPGLVMLKRNAPGWQPRAGAEPLRAEPLPPLMTGGYPADTREWQRVPAPQHGYLPGGQSGYFVPDAAQPTYYQPEPQATAPAPTHMTDQVQNARLDQLERTIRGLSAELVTERRLVSELRRETVGNGEPPPRRLVEERVEYEVPQTMHGPRQDYGISAALNERLSVIERSVEARFADIANGWTVLGERLQGLEQAVNANRTSEPAVPAALMDRLQGLENISGAIAKLSDRLQSLERQVASRAQASPVSLEPVMDRLNAIEHAQTLRPAATASALAPVVERLAAIERVQANRPAAPQVDLHPVFDRIAALERSIGNRLGQGHDFGPVMERLQVIDGRVAEINRGATGIADRVGQFERKLEAAGQAADRTANNTAERVRAIEEAMVAQRNQIAQLATNVTGEVKMLAQTVAAQATAQASGAERIQALVGERMQGLSSAFDQTRTDLVTTVAQPLAERIGLLQRFVETHRAEATQVATETAERTAAIEKLIQGFGQRTLDLHAAHGADLVELHNEMVKLNGNQQTLASSMDQWRIESGNETSGMLGRLDGVERAVAKPTHMLENLQTSVDLLQRTTVKREEQRSRFRQWLMGTDDWYGASWENGSGHPTRRT